MFYILAFLILRDISIKNSVLILIYFLKQTKIIFHQFCCLYKWIVGQESLAISKPAFAQSPGILFYPP